MSFRAARSALFLAVLVVSATACQKAGEAALSAATGGAVDINCHWCGSVVVLR
jgi:hypothetical protein